MKRFLSLATIMMALLLLASTGLFSTKASAETSDVYTITYHLDGGTNALKNPDVYTTEDTITLMPATKVGYDFLGWYLDSDKTEQIAEISNRTGNIELYTKFAPKSYVGVFNDNGATSSNPIRIKLYNSLGIAREVLLNNGDVFDPYANGVTSRSGMVFLGWYNRSTLVSGSLKISRDFALEPKWKECEINYHKGILGEDLDSIAVEPDVNNDIYSCSEYVYVSAGITTVHYEGESCAKSVYYLNKYQTTIEGSFSIYDVTHQTLLVAGLKGSNRKESGDLTVAPGTLLRITTTCGHYAGGVPGGYNAPGKCSLTAGNQRSANITVLNQREIEQEFDSTINTPNVKKTGYDLLGWYDADGNQMTKTWQYTSDQTFTAKWTPIEYNISYNLDGGTNHASNPAKYTIEDTITLKDPTKPGYTFKGWYSDANFKTQVTSISNRTGNITLYAKWKANSYNLTLNANAGAFAPKVTFISDGVEVKSGYLYGQDTITAYRPTGKDGYIFAGWYTDDTFTSLFKFNGTIKNDITLHAKWVECNSNIVNIESVGNVNATIQGKTEQLYAFVPLVNGKITVSSDSNNLDLYGILYDASKNVLISADDISSTDLDFTYTYSVKAGQLYYIAVKGNTASTAGQAVINIAWTGDCGITGTTYQNRQISVVYDTNYTLPQKPIREGYLFLGWFDENDTQITDGIWNFATDKILTAKWEEATYHTVVFKDLAGNIISSETYYLSEDIVAPELPTKAADETYAYHAKWDNDYTGVCIGDAVYSPAFDAEYIEYTVVFLNEDGTELSRETYHWGDAITPPSAPAKATDTNYANTYTFAGWDSAVVNCAGNATYTATYTAVPLKELVVTSQPHQVRYRTGDSLDLAGLTLRLVYSNGASISLDSVDAQLVSADLSTPGRKTVTITIAGVSAEIEVYVHDVAVIVTVDSSLYPQSSHDYRNNLDETKTFTYPGAQSLTITFNSQTSVEKNYDYIYVYDGTGNQIAKYTGTTAANKTLTITGNTFKVRLTSDYSNVKYGYAFSSIQANMGAVGEIIHQPVVDPATVTCTQNGLTEGSHCDICGDILVAQEEIAALGHNYETAFTWSEDHTSCTAVITCERDCGLYEVVDCTVTHSKPNQAQTAHTAVAEYNGERFTDILTCGNFLITFKDWDGTQISSTYYHAGDTVIAPANPTRIADKTYTYTFAGWDKMVVDCVGNATYTATYTSTYIDYTVVFQNWNGVILSIKTYHYGDKVTAPSNPTKAADKTYAYTFAGWDNAVVNCVDNTTYTATYTSTYIDYTVVFKNWDGGVIEAKIYHYGDKVTAPANPIRLADEIYTYTFAGWDNVIVNCVGSTTYTATYTQTYTDHIVTFKNWDGSVLATNTYHYGDVVQEPNTPTKETDVYGTYVFSGWDKTVTSCTGNATYTATYQTEYTDYVIKFQDWNGAILSSKTYHYGDKVTAPSTPTRISDNTYYYTFKCWDKPVVDCAGSATYTATYTPTYINYTIIFMNWDGSLICNKSYHWGEDVAEPQTPTREKDGYYQYTFSGWDAEVGACFGNAVYHAIFAEEHYHTYFVKEIGPSCTKQGYTTHICACGDSYTDSYVNETGHSYDNACDTSCNICGATRSITHSYITTTIKATLTKNGSIVKKCSVCGDVASSTTIARPTTFTLSTVNYTYNGAVKTPGVTVKDANGKTLVKGTDYTVSYPSGRTALGTYKVTITMKGNYSGTKTLTFKIGLATPTVKVSNATTGVKVSWNKISGAKTYTVYRSVYTNGAWSAWTAIKSGVTGTSFTDTSVKSNANVKYTVRAVNGNYASAYTSSSAIKFLAKPTVTIANAATGVKVSWNKISGAKTYTIYRSVYSGGKWSGWTVVKTGATGTSYTDTTVKSGATVRYTVRAVNGKYASAYTASNTTKFLVQPKVTVAKATNGIKATWGKITGASGYIVYRRTYSNGKWGAWEKVKTTTALSFTDTTAKKGVTYQYTVRAYSGDYKSTYTNSTSIKR